MELLAQGAEAKLFRDKNKVIKQRLSKEYRVPQLDESLRKFRTRREAKILRKLEDLQFPAPRLHDFCDKRMSITMDFIEGPTVKNLLHAKVDSHSFEIAQEIGSNLGILHKNNMIHGDLTTSNILQEIESKNLRFIDFGLSAFTDKVEDKAVDLHLLEQALTSTHTEHSKKLFAKVLEGYKAQNPQAQEILTRLEKVAARGRHKK